jgi:hypothetical protein
MLCSFRCCSWARIANKLMGMRFEKIWVEQCKATRKIRRRFGVKSALDYLIGEKLVRFAQEAERRPEFAKEFPRFLAAVWQAFNQFGLQAMWPRRSQASDRNYGGYSIRAERFPAIPGPEGPCVRAGAEWIFPVPKSAQ